MFCHTASCVSIMPCMVWVGVTQGYKLSFTFHGGVFYGRGSDLRLHPSDEEGSQLIATLCAKGHAKSILLSQGVCCKIQQKRYGR